MPSVIVAYLYCWELREEETTGRFNIFTEKGDMEVSETKRKKKVNTKITEGFI